MLFYISYIKKREVKRRTTRKVPGYVERHYYTPLVRVRKYVTSSYDNLLIHMKNCQKTPICKGNK